MDMDAIMNDIRILRESRYGYDPESQLDFNWPEPESADDIDGIMKSKPRVLARDGNVISVGFG